MYSEFGLTTPKEKIYAQQISPNRFIHQFIVKQRFWNKPTYSSLRTELEAVLQQVEKHGIEKISVPRLATGLDWLNWLKIKVLIMKFFYISTETITVCTQLKQQKQTVNPGRTQSDTESKTEMQQAQEEKQSPSTTPLRVKNGKQPHRSFL